MIPQFNGFKKEKISTAVREILPHGGYVGKILRAEIVNYSWGSQLVISYDITEGEYTGFFRKDWDNQNFENKKWRGTLKLGIPTGDGSDQDGWKVNAINNLAASLEESNAGYVWDWDEAKLKGKMLGFLVREFEWSMNGNTGISTETSSCTDVETVRSGKFRIPKRRKLKNTNTDDAPASAVIDDPDDLPF